MRSHPARLRLVLERRHRHHQRRSARTSDEPNPLPRSRVLSATPKLTNVNAKALRKAALAYPDTFEDFPWDHHAYKAPNKKVFLFLTGADGGGFNCSLKLPYRNEEALQL